MIRSLGAWAMEQMHPCYSIKGSKVLVLLPDFFVFLKINLSSYSAHNQVIIFKQRISMIILLSSATDKNK